MGQKGRTRLHKTLRPPPSPGDSTLVSSSFSANIAHPKREDLQISSLHSIPFPSLPSILFLSLGPTVALFHLVMRIRKCASKLLGSTIAYFSPPPPCSSPAWDSRAASAAAAAAAAAGILCRLNRSPWDLLPNDQNAVCKGDEDADPATAEDVEDERKTLEPPLIKSGVKIKVEEEEEEEKLKKKVKRKRMKKGTDSTVATKTGETAAPLCKKSDGKGWHCKRPAHLPHSLCHYHLTQLRSYTNNNSRRTVADQATGGDDNHRKKKKADAAGDGNNFYYYYYSGFGPWRRKRRGSNYGGDKFGGGINGHVTEEEGRENSESVDGHDAPVTGDDEEDNEEDKSDEEDEEKNCRKTGRKPVKARSLKSLL